MCVSVSVTVRNVAFTYDKGTADAVPALSDISFCVPDGAFVGVTGHTGSGKSTLFSLLCGLDTPDAGEITVNGISLTDAHCGRAALRRTVGAVFQFPEKQLFARTVLGDVMFGLSRRGMPKQEMRERARNALRLVGFSDARIREIEGESPLALSGGEKRKTALAGILVCEPRVLLLDEPVAGLDGGARVEFLSLLDRLHGDGVTIFMISHQVDALCEHTERMLVLENGRLIRDCLTEELYADADFLHTHRLGTSFAADLASRLRARGCAVPRTVVRRAELLPYLVRLGKGERL